MKEKKQSDLSVLLGYAGSCRGLTFLGLGLSAVAMVLGMLPYLCIWLAARDLIAAAPNWTQAAGIVRYGWLAFAPLPWRGSQSTSPLSCAPILRPSARQAIFARQEWHT